MKTRDDSATNLAELATTEGIFSPKTPASLRFIKRIKGSKYYNAINELIQSIETYEQFETNEKCLSPDEKSHANKIKKCEIKMGCASPQAAGKEEVEIQKDVKPGFFIMKFKPNASISFKPLEEDGHIFLESEADIKKLDIFCRRFPKVIQDLKITKATCPPSLPTINNGVKS